MQFVWQSLNQIIFLFSTKKEEQNQLLKALFEFSCRTFSIDYIDRNSLSHDQMPRGIPKPWPDDLIQKSKIACFRAHIPCEICKKIGQFFHFYFLKHYARFN